MIGSNAAGRKRVSISCRVSLNTVHKEPQNKMSCNCQLNEHMSLVGSRGRMRSREAVSGGHRKSNWPAREMPQLVLHVLQFELVARVVKDVTSEADKSLYQSLPNPLPPSQLTDCCAIYLKRVAVFKSCCNCCVTYSFFNYS